MSTDLEPRQQVLVPNLETGEAVDLASAYSEDIAHALFALRNKESELKEWKAQMGEELLKRMDKAAAWTQHWGAFSVKGSSPQPQKEVDLEPLMATLEELEGEGHITRDAATNAIKTELVHKPNWSGINALLKLGGEVKERLSKHIRETERRRYAPSVQMTRPE